MQSKTTRAFRTISEAGDELDLQPHVLRFWESKFSDIKPIKRGGGRRFYRPEDIEFLRGIKILLHDEGHPIKDVQKLIRLKGPNRVMELGQSVQKASKDKKVEDTILVPERIKKTSVTSSEQSDKPQNKIEDTVSEDPITAAVINIDGGEASNQMPPPVIEKVLTKDSTDEGQQHLEEVSVPQMSGEVLQQRQDLEEALDRLLALKARWGKFTGKNTSSV